MTTLIFLFSTCLQEIRYVGEIINMKNCHKNDSQFFVRCTENSSMDTFNLEEVLGECSHVVCVHYVKATGEFSPTVWAVRVFLFQSMGEFPTMT